MAEARGLGGALVLIGAAFVAAPTHATAQDWRTISSMRQLGSEQQLRVDLEYAAGRLTITPGADRMLYRSSLRYDADIFDPNVGYENGVLRFGFDAARLRGRNVEPGQLDLVLGTVLPLDLDLRFGAAEAELELGGLRVRRASISTGASHSDVHVSTANPERCERLTLEVGAADFAATGLGNLNTESLRLTGGVGKVTLDFSGEWRGDMDAEVEMGLGALVMRVPRGIGVRVRKRGILASFEGSGLIRNGDVYVSENWDDADHRMTVDIAAALGAIRVEWIDG